MQKLKEYEQIENESIRSKLRNFVLRRGKKVIHYIENYYHSKNRVQFIYFHHLLNDEISGFREIISYIKSKYSVVSYSEAVRRVLEGPIMEPTICISFDDGLKSCLRAARILHDNNISACFFVCPRFVTRRSDAARVKYSSRLNLPKCEFLSWEDIEEMLEMGHEIGGHTLSHQDLSTLSLQELTKEISGSYEILESRVGPPLHFAWPYGRFNHFTERAARLVFDAGYVSCASAERGCHARVHRESRSGLCIRRDVLVAGRPLFETKFFLALNALFSNRQENNWPDEWNVSRNTHKKDS